MIIQVNQHYFHLIENHNDAFNQEMFEGRYSEILDRYPYVVGDIGFEQLRLKGFFDDRKKGADVSRKFSAIQDYLLEYCNFGCPFFVLKRLTESEVVKLTQPEEITDIEPQQATGHESSADYRTEQVNESNNESVDTVDVQTERSELLVETVDETTPQPTVNKIKTFSDFLK